MTAKLPLLAAFAAPVFIHAVCLAQTRYEPTWESLDSRDTPEWWTDAKFGIVVHWGLYSVLAWSPKGENAEWYWHSLRPRDPNQRSLHEAVESFHLSAYGEAFGYEDFRDGFTAELFDPGSGGHSETQRGALCRAHFQAPRWLLPLAQRGSVGKLRSAVEQGGFGAATRPCRRTLGVGARRWPAHGVVLLDLGMVLSIVGDRLIGQTARAIPGYGDVSTIQGHHPPVSTERDFFGRGLGDG